MYSSQDSCGPYRIRHGRHGHHHDQWGHGPWPLFGMLFFAIPVLFVAGFAALVVIKLLLMALPFLLVAGIVVAVLHHFNHGGPPIDHKLYKTEWKKFKKSDAWQQAKQEWFNEKAKHGWYVDKPKREWGEEKPKRDDTTETYYF